MAVDTTERTQQQVYPNDDFYHPARKFAFLFQGGPVVFWLFGMVPLFFFLVLPNAVPSVFGHLAGYAPLVAIPMVLLILPSYGYRVTWPVAKPIVEGGLDYGIRKPGMSASFEKAGGIAWLGTVRKGKRWGQPVFLTNAMLRAHLFILGTTGAGKTQTILGFLWSFLVMGSGFTLVDGKGDIATWHMICSMAWLAGAEDDLLLINYTTGDTTLWNRPVSRMSITINLLATGSLNTVSGLIKALLGEAPKGDNRIWHERTVSFIEAVLTPLVYLRDHHNFQLSTQTLREYISLPAVKDLRKKQLKINGRDRVFSDIPDRAIDPIRTYLSNLPGYRDDAPPDYASDPANQAAVQAMPQGPSEEENKQHGFVTMQLIRSLNAMSDSFGHIFNTKYSELDWDDVVLNRRIVCTILPSLEKPPSDLEILGKIIVAGNKMMLARLLGTQINKEVDEPVDPRVTEADHPYSLMYDEKASYMVEGEEDILAQGRSLGCSVGVGSQDFPRLTEKSKAGAAAIASCTGIKCFMKLQDEESLSFSLKYIGKAWMRRAQYWRVRFGLFSTTRYADSSHIEEFADRATNEQIMAQKSGQMFMVIDGRPQEIASAYFPWPKLPEWRMSHGAVLHIDDIYGDSRGHLEIPEPLNTVTEEPYPGDPPAVSSDKAILPEPKTRVTVSPLDQRTIQELTEKVANAFRAAATAEGDTQPPMAATDDGGTEENIEWSDSA
jgi:intracellular multiplication protein IcmO